jgi:hypothetical protein
MRPIISIVFTFIRDMNLDEHLITDIKTYNDDVTVCGVDVDQDAY